MVGKLENFLSFGKAKTLDVSVNQMSLQNVTSLLFFKLKIMDPNRHHGKYLGATELWNENAK